MRQRLHRDRTRHSPASEGPRARSLGAVPWVPALVLLLAAAVLWAWWNGRRPETARPAAAEPVERPDPAFPPATAEVIGLAPEPPQTVGGLKDEALEVCRRLIAELPERPEARAVMALTCMRLGQTADAERTWRECLAMAPRFSPGHFGLGEIAMLQADYAAAERHLRAAIEINPGLPGAYNRLIEALLHQGLPEQALPLAREHARRSPRLPESHFWLGQTCIDLRRYAEARSAHEAAIALHPQLSASYFSLAKACAALGQREKAAEYRRQFAELKNRDMADDRGRNRQYRDLPAQQELVAGVHRSAGDVQLLAENPLKAEAHWLRGVAIAAGNIPCREALVALYERQGRLEAALGLLERLQAIAPERASFWCSAGGILARRGEFAAAEAAYREALRRGPEEAEPRLGLVQLHLRSGRDLPDVLVLAEHATKTAPSAHAYLLLSAVRSQRGDHAGALAAIENALRLEPDNAELRQAREQLIARP